MASATSPTTGCACYCTAASRGRLTGPQDCEAAPHAWWRRACKGGVPALEHGDEDDVPVFGAEVSTIPWRIPKWPDRAMSAEEVCWCGLGSPTVPQDYSSAGAKRIEHCLGVALGDTAGHGASSG